MNAALLAFVGFATIGTVVAADRCKAEAPIQQEHSQRDEQKPIQTAALDSADVRLAPGTGSMTTATVVDVSADGQETITQERVIAFND